jgi:hypothetical protein
MSAYGINIGSGIEQVFVFRMGEYVSKKIVKEAGKVIAEINSATVNTGFIAQILFVIIIPKVILIIKILVYESESHIELVNCTNTNFGRNGDPGHASKLETQVAAHRDPAPEVIRSTRFGSERWDRILRKRS